MSETAAFHIVTAPEMNQHPFDSEAELAEFVRAYVAEHGERDARTNLAIYAHREGVGPTHTVPLDRYLEGSSRNVDLAP